MSKLTLIVVALALLVPTALLADPAPAQPSVNEAERVVELFEALAVDLEGKEESCKKVSKSLEVWWSTHQAELTLLVQTSAPTIETLSANEQEELDRRLRPAMGTLFNAAMKCSEHKATTQLLEEIDALLSTQQAVAADGL